MIILQNLKNILDISIGETIKDRASEISQILSNINDAGTLQLCIDAIRLRIQDEARIAFNNNRLWGAMLMATGTGKSKIAIDKVETFFKVKSGNPHPKILLVVPTIKLRDNNWKEEFYKWGCPKEWDLIERCCYVSLNKYKGEIFDFVILDEGHNITEDNSIFFDNNTVKSCLWLSATKPSDPTKIEILRKLKIYPIYELSLDVAVKLGLVAPYDVTVITTTLDDVDKYIQSGNAKKKFFQTEKAKYGYLSLLLKKIPSKASFLNRMRFIYNLKSKTEAAKWILENVIPKDIKTLIFCGGIEQAIEVCDRRFFSKPTYTKYKGNMTKRREEIETEKKAKVDFKLYHWEGDEGFFDFKKNIINRLSCCEALNEGENIDGIDCGFIIQINSKELDLIQRLGRFIRFRPNHVGRLIILCVSDSIDKNWVENATKSLDSSNIRWVELSKLKDGTEKILFN